MLGGVDRCAPLASASPTPAESPRSPPGKRYGASPSSCSSPDSVLDPASPRPSSSRLPLGSSPDVAPALSVGAGLRMFPKMETRSFRLKDVNSSTGSPRFRPDPAGGRGPPAADRPRRPRLRGWPPPFETKRIPTMFPTETVKSGLSATRETDHGTIDSTTLDPGFKERHEKGSRSRLDDLVFCAPG
jgi:hypothetical protein